MLHLGACVSAQLRTDGSGEITHGQVTSLEGQWSITHKDAIQNAEGVTRMRWHQSVVDAERVFRQRYGPHLSGVVAAPLRQRQSTSRSSGALLSSGAQ